MHLHNHNMKFLIKCCKTNYDFHVNRTMRMQWFYGQLKKFEGQFPYLDYDNSHKWDSIFNYKIYLRFSSELNPNHNPS